MSAKPDGVAVFGSSEPGPGDPLYRLARQLGGLLARAGYPVVNGAYGGVMEAVSRGAWENGGRTVGVACSIFGHRQPNPFLSEVVSTPDLFMRTRELVERSRGFVVLDGKAGTLAELSLLWALHRAGCLVARPVVLLGGRWQPLLDHLQQSGRLDPAQFGLNRVVKTPEDVLRALDRAWNEP